MYRYIRGNSLTKRYGTHLGHTGRVLVDNLGHTAREGVGRLVPEDVAHVAAGDDLQGTATLPHSAPHNTGSD